jgi:hypothetical protein
MGAVATGLAVASEGVAEVTGGDGAAGKLAAGPWLVVLLPGTIPAAAAVATVKGTAMGPKRDDSGDKRVGERAWGLRPSGGVPANLNALLGIGLAGE